jgi:hypothetical protein
MVRFLIVEQIQPGSNPRFNIDVTYLQLIILSVVADVPVDSEMLLVTDFVNLKIMSTQSFKGAYKSRVYVHIFIGGILIYV